MSHGMVHGLDLHHVNVNVNVMCSLVCCMAWCIDFVTDAWWGMTYCPNYLVVLTYLNWCSRSLAKERSRSL